MCIEQIAEISKALLTPVVVIITVFIAYQQWKTNQQKLRLDIFDRRLKVYGEVKKILGLISRDANVSHKELSKFINAVSEADFLFEKEIPLYINEIYRRGLSLRIFNQKYKDYTQTPPDGYDHEKVCDEMNEDINWLTCQFESVEEKFKKYLQIKT